MHILLAHIHIKLSCSTPSALLKKECELMQLLHDLIRMLDTIGTVPLASFDDACNRLELAGLDIN